MRAIRIHRHDGPNVLAYEDVGFRQPGAGEIVVRNRATEDDLDRIVAINLRGVFLCIKYLVSCHAQASRRLDR